MVILLVLYIFSSVDLYAQNLEIELFLRPALTSLRGNDVLEDHLDPTVYPTAGIELSRLFVNGSVISVGMMYDMKGGSDEKRYTLRDDRNEPIGSDIIKTTSDFQYLTMPVQWGFRFGNKVKCQVGIGIYSSLLMKQEMTTEMTGYSNTTEFTEQYKKIDVGASASFSVYMPLKKHLALMASIDDYLGLFDAMSSDVKHNGAVKHNSFGIALGLKYAFQSKS